MNRGLRIAAADISFGIAIHRRNPMATCVTGVCGAIDRTPRALHWGQRDDACPASSVSVWVCPCRSLADGARRAAPGNDPRRNVPIANFNRDDRQVNLNVNWEDNRNPNYAVPSRLGVFDTTTDAYTAPVVAFTRAILSTRRACVRPHGVSTPQRGTLHLRCTSCPCRGE